MTGRAVRGLLLWFLAMLAGAAKDADVTVIDEVPPGDGLAVRADRRRLRRLGLQLRVC